MIVHFVNIGGIVDRHCLNFLFTILNCHLLPINQLYIRSIFQDISMQNPLV
jgi:hypothetical protein